MKLNQEQLDVIDAFLNRMELTHVDLRHEVFDHMVTGVEYYLEKGFSFKEAADVVTEKWHPELRSHQSFWLGLVHTGPKLMIDKCVKITKKIYFKSAVLAFLFTIPFNFFEQVFVNEVFIGILKYGFGALLAIGVVVFLFWALQPQIREAKTTYSFLIKLNMLGYLISALTLNPFVSEGLFTFDKPALGLLNIFCNAFIIVFGYESFRLFKSHKSHIKRAIR